MDLSSVGTALAMVATSAWAWWERHGRKRLEAERAPWVGDERRDGATVAAVLTGARVRNVLEDGSSDELPRQWEGWVRVHVAERLDSVLVPRLTALEVGQADMRLDLRDLTAKLERLIGRLLREEPIG